ncbi:S26 family signal peptidase [Sphingopyxis sp. R3-92]|uniref:S26 family signal peptidase n=1 Tax=Sphingopyxis sp. R3-92 TaxID=3158553 RepID=UPI003EE65175
MNRRWLAATAGFTALFGLGFAATDALAPHPRLIWNASASAPVGLYRITSQGCYAVGDLVLIRPGTHTVRFLAERRYVPMGTPLLKRIAALPGDTVCREGAMVRINGRAAAAALARDRWGRALPHWSGCRTLRGGDLFLLNTPQASLDSRYFGPMPASGLIGAARPLLTREAPGAPLRWRRVAPPKFPVQH